MADSSELGYPVERFETAVSRRFHCSICLNVFKDPVMCRRNQHPFCRACITRHLMNFETCPVCKDQLTVDTLSDAPRILTDYLSELRMRCDFHQRGCSEYVKLDDLERHVNDCGFAPSVCSNEGCLMVVNKSELAYHETTVCEQRIAKCHNCEQLTQEVGELRANLTVVSSKLNQMESTLTTAVKTLGEATANLGVFMNNLSAKVDNRLDAFTAKLNRLEAIEYQLQEHQQKMNTRFTAISEPLAKLSKLESDQQSIVALLNHGSISENNNETLNVVIAGGITNGKKLESVEKFNLSTGAWSKEQAMQISVYEASSALHQNQVIVCGGRTSFGVSNNMVRRNIGIKSADWTRVVVPLPTKLRGHCSVVCDNHLYIIGGCYENGTISSAIYTTQLIPPYRSNLLTRLPGGMSHHSVQLFGDQLVIVGGIHGSWSYQSRICNVFLYNISKNEWKRLAPVPFAGVREMATVRWGDNIIIIGGTDVHNKPLKTVVMYNIKTQLSDVLPNMKNFRRGCVAAVLGNSIVAIGGATHELKCLNTVECFDFKRFSWQELSPLNEARYLATGVAF